MTMTADHNRDTESDIRNANNDQSQSRRDPPTANEIRPKAQREPLMEDGGVLYGHDDWRD
jgi:hypothetical protein